MQQIITRFAQKKKHVFFIQIGSNDGVTRDPLNHHITQNNWRGIVVEPVAYIYKKLVDTYRHVPGVICENVAIADEEGTRKLYRLKENNDGLPEWYDQLGSFDSAIVQAHRHKIKDFDTYFMTDFVDCVTLDALMDKHAVETIDLLHIDTEGYDYEIIKMLNFSKFKPAIIMFEHKHLPSETYRQAVILLKEQGYHLYRENNDTLAKLAG